MKRWILQVGTRNRVECHSREMAVDITGGPFSPFTVTRTVTLVARQPAPHEEPLADEDGVQRQLNEVKRKQNKMK